MTEVINVVQRVNMASILLGLVNHDQTLLSMFEPAVFVSMEGL